MLFRHRTAHEVCLSQRVARKILEDLHDLLLVDDDAERLFQDGLEHGRQVLDVLGVGAVPEVFGDEIHGPRAIERDARDEVFEAVGLKLLHKLLHAPLLELEHGVRVAFGDELIGIGVVARLVELHRLTRILFDVVERLFDIGERGERQKVHLQHPDGLHFLHVELGGDVLAVARERHVVGDLLAADDDARRVHPRLTGHPLELQSHIDDALQRGIALIEVDKFLIALALLIGELFQRLLMLVGVALRLDDGLAALFEVEPQKFADGGLAVHEFGDAVGLGVRDAHDAPHVLDDGARGERAEGDDLRDVLGMIALADIGDGLLAAGRTEVDVEVGHGHAVGVQEALKEKVVAQRIDVRDADGIGDDAADARAAPRPDGDIVQARPVDVVPHDEEVIGKAHLDDDGELVLGALSYFLRDDGIALGKPLPGEPRQVLGRGRAVVRRVERDERLVVHGVAVRLQVEGRVRIRDLVCDDARVGDGFGEIGKERRHLVARLHIELMRLHPHPVGIVQRLFHLDAHQHILHLPIFLAEIVHVVGGNERDARLARDAHDERQDLLLFGDAVILDLEVEVLPVDLLHGERERLCPLVISLHEKAGEPSRETRRKADDPLRVIL